GDPRSGSGEVSSVGIEQALGQSLSGDSRRSGWAIEWGGCERRTDAEAGRSDECAGGVAGYGLAVRARGCGSGGTKTQSYRTREDRAATESRYCRRRAGGRARGNPLDPCLLKISNAG